MYNNELGPRERADQRALTDIGQDILRVGRGGKMTTSLQLQDRLDVGSGTIQKATRHLENVGAVRLRVRGHQGTIVEDFDPALVWRAAGLQTLRIVLPPPGALESTAIATSIRHKLAERRVSVEFDFVPGARNRLDRLSRAGSQPTAVLMSRGAAGALEILDHTDYDFLGFGRDSYYHPLSLVRLSSGRERKGALRVARDPQSYDHAVLTEREFGSEVQIVDCSFVEVPGAILDDKADAGIWHRVVTTISPEQAGLDVSPAKDPGSISTESSFTEALIVWSSDRGEVGALLSDLNLKDVTARLNRLVSLGADSEEVRNIVPWL